jgi:hypothetical protein
MECCTFYHGVFGLWGWEYMAEGGELVEECRQVFETYEECVADAREHGYRPGQNARESKARWTASRASTRRPGADARIPVAA